MEAKKEFPARPVLLDALKRLQEASEKNEQLTRDLAKGKELPPEIRKEVEDCIAEQSKIVNYFIELSEDQEAKKRYLELVAAIENLISRLEQAEKMEELEELKVKIGDTVQNWVSALEEIVAGVLNRAKE